MGSFIKWLLIHKGSKIVTINDQITDVQTVMYRWKGRIFTKEWAGKVYYNFDDIRLATRKETKLGKKENLG
ncbi:hypothetical protein QE380_000177 [Acinetobacter baylyi]|uniref:Uncharacterized protein n=2 Tax=Acinetobacter baylyi TaxID=202950 RepID=A0ABU0URT3_ACIBI|nr:hypothetical protein [Acinetobacter baylyi]MDQ1207254.1 hypothetical protein [Acinetobacter baylyi]MDR6187615.1 hypothetical protein [Acinetobacter baylyi]